MALKNFVLCKEIAPIVRAMLIFSKLFIKWKIMRVLTALASMLFALASQADTIEHYMNIANNIPQMEMKADPQAQAWARSARNVLTITSETVAETLMQANELAKSQGRPLFCLPEGTALNAVTLNGIIANTYKEISSQQSDKDKMTVSQVAWLGVIKAYPCQNMHSNQMQHVSAMLGK